MIDFISNLIGNDALATVLMSFLPLIELKGGIVFAWGKFFFIKTFILAYVGSSVAFLLVFWLLRPLIALLKKISVFNKFACSIENYFKQKANTTLEKQKNKNKALVLSENMLKILGVFIFVAIPLPMTGVWTGTAIAVFLNLSFFKAILPVCLGNLVAGLLVSLLSVVCKAIGVSLDLVLWCLFFLAIILFIVVVLKIIKGKKVTN